MGKSTIILLLIGLSIQFILAQQTSAFSKEVSNDKLNPILEEDNEIPMEPLKPSPPTDTKAPIVKRLISFGGYSNTRGYRGWGGNSGGAYGGWGGNYGGGYQGWRGNYGGGYGGGSYRLPYGGYGFYG